MKRYVEGVALVSSGSGHWASEDGQYGVQLEEGLTSCDAEHPVRLTPGLVQLILERPHVYPPEARSAIQEGKKGYLCPGSEDHTYPIWTAWTPKGSCDDMGNTMQEALGILRNAIAKERAA